MDNEKIIDITENTTEAETPEVKEKPKKQKNISINTFDKIMKATYEPTATVSWNDIDITVKKTLSLQEMMEFVEAVVQLCFDEESGNYLPEVRDFAIKLNTLTNYANFKMPQNLNHQYELIYCTNAFETVLTKVNVAQFNEMCMSIDKKIQHRVDANVEALNKQVGQLLDSFENLEQKMAALYEGVDNESMSKMISAIENGVFSEQKLVQSYFDEKDKREGAESAESATADKAVENVPMESDSE